MRLYHYLETKWALDNIRRRRLKISKIDDMNDPWEWKSLRSNDTPTQSHIESAMERESEEVGVICFSKQSTNILMWGHYGEKHRGICLGFDVAENDKLRKVKYNPRVKIIGQLGGRSPRDDVNRTVRRL